MKPANVPFWVCGGCPSHFVGSKAKAKTAGWTFDREGNAKCKVHSPRPEPAGLEGVVQVDYSELEDP